METDSSLVDLLTRELLRRKAGYRSFERGEDYFACGKVGRIAELDGTIAATVRGNSPYHVELCRDGDALGFSCSCPLGNDGIFCKHCVAVGLTWLEGGKAKPTGSRKAAAKVTMNDVRDWLLAQEKQHLAEMLLELAMGDEDLRHRLMLSATRGKATAADLEDSYRDAIDRAVGDGEFVHYRDAHAYARGIGEAIDAIEDLLNDGNASVALLLIEHAISAVEKAISSVDDSDGHMGSILYRLREIHLEACRKAKPEPADLARRLFHREMSSPWDTFYHAVASYVEVLGKEGMATYRELAEAEWAKLPPLKPGANVGYDHDRRRITGIMETLASQSGDIEALIEIKKRDLSLPYHYLEIAQIYKGVRKRDLALEWAERGVKAYPRNTDLRLREFLAEEYHRRKRHDEALALIWAEFDERPYLVKYQLLKKHADRCGQWEKWRQRALDCVRKTIKRDNRAGRLSYAGAPKHSELVRIFLWEKDVESAWREAQEGGCDNGLWMELAGKREEGHPQDSLGVYQRLIEPTLSQGNNDAYRDAVGLLRLIRGILVRLGRESEFVSRLHAVREQFKRKRNFMKMLDHARW